MVSRQIGTYETKTHLAEVLRQVQNGARYTITHRGKPVAELTPYGALPSRDRVAAAHKLRTLMSQRVPVPAGSVRELIEQGRD
jgi:prevent-host-death family protein